MLARLASLRPDLESFAAASAGALLFEALGVPAGALSGAMVGVCLLIALGRPIRLAALLRNAALLVCGVTMGAAVTPEMLNALKTYPFSLATLVLSLAATMTVTAWFLRRFGGWDRATAFFAASPGALSAVYAVSATTNADLLKITMAQSLRLFMLVAVVPAIVVSAETPTLAAARGIATPLALILMLAGGAALALLLDRVRFAGAWLFGGMLLSAVLHGSGLVAGDPPEWLVRLAYVAIGILIASRFTTITRALLVSSALISAGAFVVGLAIAVAFAAVAAWGSGVPFGQALVAFSPGGLEAMIVLGSALGLDPIYVGLHHLVRFFGIGLLLPLSLRWLDSPGDRERES
jgi:membrane AbrB-like protein